MDFDVNVRERFLKPVNEVFVAVADPEKMSSYFISGSSGPLKAGTEVVWEFADVGAKVSIDVLEVEENRKIVWESSALGSGIRTTIQFTPDGPDATVFALGGVEGPQGRGRIAARQRGPSQCQEQ